MLQTSKTNTFAAKDLQQHISSLNRKFHFQTLHKALEEIAVLYNWDRPIMHSPVKKFGKKTALNSVYVFTKLPNDNDELNQFMGKPKIKRTFTHKAELISQVTARTLVVEFFRRPAILFLTICSIIIVMPKITSQIIGFTKY